MLKGKRVKTAKKVASKNGDLYRGMEVNGGESRVCMTGDICGKNAASFGSEADPRGESEKWRIIRHHFFDYWKKRRIIWY